MISEEIQARLSICDSCERFRKAEILGRLFDMCAECGCFLAKKIRTPEATCPKDKWQKLNP